VVNWVAGAKAAYNVSIDVVGSWNEKAYNPAYLVTLRAALDDAGFSSTRILCDDFNWQCALDMPGNPALAAAVDFVGGHDVVSLPADALPGKPREKCGGAAIAQGCLTEELAHLRVQCGARSNTTRLVLLRALRTGSASCSIITWI